MLVVGLIAIALGYNYTIPTFTINSAGSGPTVYIFDPMGRTDTFAPYLGGCQHFTTAQVAAYSVNATTEMSTILGVNTTTECDLTYSQSCTIMTTLQQNQSDYASLVHMQVSSILSANPNAVIVYTAQAPLLATYLGPNLWAPTATIMKNLVVLIICLYFIIGMLPNLLLTEAEVIPEEQDKED